MSLLHKLITGMRQVRDCMVAIPNRDYSKPGTLLNTIMVLCSCAQSKPQALAYRQNFAGLDRKEVRACHYFPLSEAMQMMVVAAMAAMMLLSQSHSTEVASAYQLVLWGAMAIMQVILLVGFSKADDALAGRLIGVPRIEQLYPPSVSVTSRDIGVPTPPPLLPCHSV